MNKENIEVSSQQPKSDEEQFKEYLAGQLVDWANRAEALPKITLFNNNLKTKYVYGNRRMKIYIKLNKDETENFSFVKDVFKDQMSTDDMTRQIFLKGLDVVNKELHKGLEKIKAEAEKLANPQIESAIPFDVSSDNQQVSVM